MNGRRPGRANGAPFADTTTPILGLVQPEVGASNSTWGNKLNSNFSLIDSSVLPLAGGTLSGGLTVNGNLATTSGNIQSISATGVPRISLWAQAYNDAYGMWTTDGWVYFGTFDGYGNPITPLMWLDSAGDLGTAGSLNVTGGANIAALAVAGNASVGGTLGAGTLSTTGNVDCNGDVFGANLITAGYLYAGNSSISGSETVAGTVTAGTLASNGNADINGDVFGANLITGGGVFGATVEASVQGYKPGGGMWADSSDERVKRDIVDYETGLHRLCELRPVSYKFNGLGGTIDDGRRHVGLLAQDARLVMPELVGTRRAQLRPGDPDDTDILTLDPSALVYALVNAVQELAEQNKELRDRIRSLEERV